MPQLLPALSLLTHFLRRFSIHFELDLIDYDSVHLFRALDAHTTVPHIPEHPFYITFQRRPPPSPTRGDNAHGIPLPNRDCLFVHLVDFAAVPSQNRLREGPG